MRRTPPQHDPNATFFEMLDEIYWFGRNKNYVLSDEDIQNIRNVAMRVRIASASLDKVLREALERQG